MLAGLSSSPTRQGPFFHSICFEVGQPSLWQTFSDLKNALCELRLVGGPARRCGEGERDRNRRRGALGIRVLSGGRAGSHRIDGVGAGFVVPLWRDGLADRIEQVRPTRRSPWRCGWPRGRPVRGFLDGRQCRRRPSSRRTARPRRHDRHRHVRHRHENLRLWPRPLLGGATPARFRAASAHRH